MNTKTGDFFRLHLRGKTSFIRSQLFSESDFNEIMEHSYKVKDIENEIEYMKTVLKESKKTIEYEYLLYPEDMTVDLNNNSILIRHNDGYNYLMKLKENNSGFYLIDNFSIKPYNQLNSIWLFKRLKECLDIKENQTRFSTIESIIEKMYEDGVEIKSEEIKGLSEEEYEIFII